MNPAGFLVIVVGIVLITLAVNGRYKQALQVVTGAGAGGPASGKVATL